MCRIFKPDRVICLFPVRRKCRYPWDVHVISRDIWGLFWDIRTSHQDILRTSQRYHFAVRAILDQRCSFIYSKLIENSGMQVVSITSKFFSVVWHLLPNLGKIEEPDRILGSNRYFQVNKNLEVINSTCMLLINFE